MTLLVLQELTGCDVIWSRFCFTALVVICRINIGLGSASKIYRQSSV
jgi:hypothetical protein